MKEYNKRKYNAPSHKNGGLTIDANGNPTKKHPIANIEEEELMIKDKDGKYIFSDYLGIAEKVKKNLEKIKGKGSLENNSRRAITDYFKKQNNVLKAQEEQQNQAPVEEKALGGPLSMLAQYGIPEAISRLTNDRVSDTLPSNENLSQFGNINIPQYKVGGLMREVPKYNTGGSMIDPLFLDNLLPETRRGRVPSLIDLTEITNEPVVKSNSGQSPLDAIPDPTKIAGNITGQQRNQSGLLGNNFNIDLSDIMRVGAGAASMLDSIEPAEVVQAQRLDTSRGDSLAAGTGTSAAPILNQITRNRNATDEAVRGVSGTVQSYLNNLRQNQAITDQSSSQAMLGNKQQNDRLALARAGREDRNSQIRMQENIRTDVANEQNRAMRADLIQNTLNQVDNIASGVERKDYLQKQMEGLNDAKKKEYLMKLATMRLVNPNFKPGDVQGVIDALANDEIDIETASNQLIKFTPDGQ